MTNIWRILLIAGLLLPIFKLSAQEVQSITSIVVAVEVALSQAARDAGIQDFEIEVSQPDNRLRLQQCSAEALLTQYAANSRIPGRISVEVSCQAGQRWKIYVQGSIATRTAVPVPRWNIPRSARIGEDDLEYRDMLVTEPLSGIVDRIDLAVGKVAQRQLNAGQPMRTSSLEVPQLVHRGQSVTIRYRAGSIELNTQGTAQASGGQGDWIQVRNSSSGSLIEGRIASDGSVIVASAD